jgi:phosphomannomutase/phosphoglucomutase
MILFSRALLKKNPGAAILGEVKCSQTLYDDIAKHGGRPILWKTGHSLIKTKMKEEHALLAGEMSGHLFFADRYFGYDDAIYASLRLVEILAQDPRSIGEMLSDVPKTFVTPELRVDCPDAIKFDVVKAITARYKTAGNPVVDIDGARIDFRKTGDTTPAWGLVRASNTGPVLVMRFEAGSEAERDRLHAEVANAVAEERGKLAART